MKSVILPTPITVAFGECPACGCDDNFTEDNFNMVCGCCGASWQQKKTSDTTLIKYLGKVYQSN